MILTNGEITDVAFVCAVQQGQRLRLVLAHDDTISGRCSRARCDRGQLTSRLPDLVMLYDSFTVTLWNVVTAIPGHTQQQDGMARRAATA